MHQCPHSFFNFVGNLKYFKLRAKWDWEGKIPTKILTWCRVHVPIKVAWGNEVMQSGFTQQKFLRSTYQKLFSVKPVILQTQHRISINNNQFVSWSMWDSLSQASQYVMLSCLLVSSLKNSLDLFPWCLLQHSLESKAHRMVSNFIS